MTYISQECGCVYNGQHKAFTCDDCAKSIENITENELAFLNDVYVASIRHDIRIESFTEDASSDIYKLNIYNIKYKKRSYFAVNNKFKLKWIVG